MEREEYAHVTTILDLLPHEKLTEWRIKTGKGAANAIARKAAKAGSALHGYVEHVVTRGPNEAVRTPKDAASEVWAEWWGLQGKKVVVAQEQTFFDDGLRVQGTPDLVLEWQGGVEIVDWKLTNAVREKNLWQLGAYGRLVERSGKRVEQVKSSDGAQVFNYYSDMRVKRGRVVRLDVMLKTWEEAVLDEEEMVMVGDAFEGLATFYHQYLALPERFRE